MAVAPFNYPAKRTIADNLLTKFGQSVALRRVTNSGVAWEPTRATTDYATIAAIIDYTIQELKVGDIQSTDRRAYVAAGPLNALGITSISAGDFIVVGGVAVPVVIAKPLNPAGVTVVYDVQLRF